MNSRLTFGARGPTIDIRQDRIDVTMDRPTPNEQWKFTDANGHEHRYQNGYRTLDFVVDAEHWCDGHEGMYNHDPHMAVDEGHYECKVCREVIEPTMDPPGMIKYVAGMRHGTATGIRPDGAQVTVSLTGGDIDELRSAAAEDREAVAQRIIDTSDLVIELRFSSDGNFSR